MKTPLQDLDPISRQLYFAKVCCPDRVEYLAQVIKAKFKPATGYYMCRSAREIREAIEFKTNRPTSPDVVVAAFIAAGFKCRVIGKRYYFNIRKQDLDKVWPEPSPQEIKRIMQRYMYYAAVLTTYLIIKI